MKATNSCTEGAVGVNLEKSEKRIREDNFCITILCVDFKTAFTEHLGGVDVCICSLGLHQLQEGDWEVWDIRRTVDEWVGCSIDGSICCLVFGSCELFIMSRETHVFRSAKKGSNYFLLKGRHRASEAR